MPIYSLEQRETIIVGELIYSDEDKSFDFNHSNNFVNTASVVIAHTLQIEFLIDSKNILYAWGYLPKESWSRGRVGIPFYHKGIVQVDVGEHAEVGIGYDELSVADNIIFDEANGWVCIGNICETENIEVADNIILGINNNNELKTVWLKPILQ